MVGVLIRMKLAVLRHSLRGGRGTWMALGGLIGLGLAGGTLALGARHFAHPAIAGDLLAVTLAGWTLGWLIAAIVTGSGDDILRPEYFTPLPISPRRLAASLLGAAFVGVAPLISLIAFASLVVYATRFGVGPALVAVPAMLLQLAFVVLLSRVALGVLGVVIQSRLSAALAALVNALIYALAAQGWIVIVAILIAADQLLAAGFPPLVSTTVRALPPGWGLVAVEAASRGAWPLGIAALLGLAALIGLLLLAWARLLVWRTTTTPTGRALRSGATAQAAFPGRLLPTSSLGAVMARELRSWSRDLLRVHNLCLALFYGLIFCALPLVLGSTALLPWTGALVTTMAAAASANLYGYDGSALWLTLLTPGAARADVRGRQLAWLLTVAPVTLLLSIALTAASGQARVWPWVLAVVPALLGGAAGLVPLISVVALVPGPDPRRRGGNPLSFGDNESALLGSSYLMLLLVSVTALPASAIVLLGTTRDSVVLQWAGVPVGVGSGVLFAWWFGRLATEQLVVRGPDLLHLMRTGRPSTDNAANVAATKLPPGKAILLSLLWTAAPILIFPQGIVPLIFKLTGSDVRVWFLPLYLPSPFQWPAILAMIALGLTLAYAAVTIQRQHKAGQRRYGAPAH